MGASTTDTARTGATGTDLTWDDIAITRSFRAMNTGVELRAIDPLWAPELAAAERAFHEIERRFSRFRPDSELSLLNGRAIDTVAASPMMLDILARALELHRATGGVFDPSILPHLERAGYDRSFETLPRELHTVEPPTHVAPRRPFAGVVIDRPAQRITLPAGLRLDLGGIGKGYAVDLAASALAPARDFLINAGGDMFASGRGPDGPGWYAGVVDPFDGGRNVSLLWLSNQALATSTTAVRRWRRGGEERHHIIDPRTRSCADSGVVSVSVVASIAVAADVLAKSALILGVDRGMALLRRHQVSGLFVRSDGSCIASTSWPGDIVV